MDKIDFNMLEKVYPILDAAVGRFLRSVEYKDWKTAYILLDAIACTARKHADAALKTVECQKTFINNRNDEIALLERCKNFVFNPFEPDNQHSLYSELNERIAQLRALQ